MAKMIKRLENGSDWDICVFGPLKNGRYAVTIYDWIERSHGLHNTYETEAEALKEAKHLNNQYKTD